MTLSQLRTFTAVARHGSLTAAARELSVSVPAVSAALASLRREFGDELVVRSGAGVALTAGGLRLAGAAAEMVGIADRAHRAVLEAREGSALLRIAATNEIGEYVIGPLIEAFRRGRPRVQVAVTTALAIELEPMLRDHRADVALGPRITAEGIESVPFLRVRAIVVAPSGHPLAGARAIDPDELRHERWIVGPGGADPYTPLSALARSLGIPLEQVREQPSHAGAISAIAMGGGIGPAISHVVAEQLRTGALVHLDVAGTPFESFWRLNSLDGDRRVDAASLLRRFIVQPEATRAIMSRSTGTTAERFRPTVHVTIWSGD